MRRLSVLVLLLGALVLPGGPAAAAGCVQLVAGDGICISDVEVGSSPAPTSAPQATPVQHTSKPAGPPACREGTGKQVPCTRYGFSWLGAGQCYAAKTDPQPPAGSPAWAGHDPAEGAIWSCVVVGQGTGYDVFVAGGLPAPQIVDAAAAALTLMQTAPFEVARLSTAPAAPARSYVNLSTWLWIPDQQWHDVNVGVSPVGARITLRAEPLRLTWTMGDGGAAVCDGPGRPWVATYGDDQVSDCSYTYAVTSTSSRAPQAAFPLTGRIEYQVTWHCDGLCSAPDGDLGVHAAPAGVAALVVGERQSVVVGGVSS